MQRCPSCGYRNPDWPAISWIVGLGVLCMALLVFLAGTDRLTLNYRLAVVAVWFLCLAGVGWRRVRSTRLHEKHAVSLERAEGVSPKAASQ